jgi:Fe-S cluster biogenesis protein NfuA
LKYQELRKKCNKEIGELRLFLENDGGDLKFVSLKQNVLKVKFGGNCADCPTSILTFKECIQRELKDRIPELKKVELVEK